MTWQPVGPVTLSHCARPSARCPDLQRSRALARGYGLSLGLTRQVCSPERLQGRAHCSKSHSLPQLPSSARHLSAEPGAPLGARAGDNCRAESHQVAARPWGSGEAPADTSLAQYGNSCPQSHRSPRRAPSPAWGRAAEQVVCEQRQPRVRTANQRFWRLTRSGLTLSKGTGRLRPSRPSATTLQQQLVLHRCSVDEDSRTRKGEVALTESRVDLAAKLGQTQVLPSGLALPSPPARGLPGKQCCFLEKLFSPRQAADAFSLDPVRQWGAQPRRVVGIKQITRVQKAILIGKKLYQYWERADLGKVGVCARCVLSCCEGGLSAGEGESGPGEPQLQTLGFRMAFNTTREFRVKLWNGTSVPEC